MKSKFILKVNSLWINIEAQNVASEVLSKHTENLKKKGNDFLIIVVLYNCNAPETFVQFKQALRLFCKACRPRILFIRSEF